MSHIIPFPADKLVRNVAVLAQVSSQHSTMSPDEMIAVAEQARDQMATVAEWLERVRQQLAEH